MNGNNLTTVELKENQLQFLDRMVENYALPDRSKALRCLIAFAMQESEKEESIFGEIRCLDC